MTLGTFSEEVGVGFGQVRGVCGATSAAMKAQQPVDGGLSSCVVDEDRS